MSWASRNTVFNLDLPNNALLYTVSHTLSPNKFATVSSRNQTMSTFWQRTLENAKMKAFTPRVSSLYRYRNRARESANIGNQFICLITHFSLFSPSPFSPVKCSNVHTHTHRGTLLKQKCEALCHQFNLLKSYVSLTSSSLYKVSFIP